MYSVAVDRLRPWAGSFSICSRSTILPTTAFSVCSTALIATTSTRSSTLPTSIWKSTRAVWAADRATFDCAPLNPVRSTVTTYCPIGTLVMM